MISTLEIHGESRTAKIVPQAAFLVTPVLASSSQDKNRLLRFTERIRHDAIDENASPEARLLFDAKQRGQSPQGVTRQGDIRHIQCANERALVVSVQALQFVYDEFQVTQASGDGKLHCLTIASQYISEMATKDRLDKTPIEELDGCRLVRVID